MTRSDESKLSEAGGPTTSSEGASSPGWWRPVGLVGLVVAVLALAKLFGLGGRLGELRDWIATLGAMGPVVFVLIYIAATVAAVPGSALTVGAGALFGSILGVVLVSVASTVGASLAFAVSRYFARDAAARWLARNEKFGRLDKLTEEHGAIIVALTRLTPIFPFNLLNYGFGLTSVPFSTYVFWSWLCMLPGTVLYVVGADALAKGLSQGRIPWVLLGALAVSALFLAFLVRYARRALKEKEAGATSAGQPNHSRHRGGPRPFEEATRGGKTFWAGPRILNHGPIPNAVPETSVAEELYTTVGRLLGAATFDLETSRLDYAALRDVEAYEAYVALSASLRHFDLGQLARRTDRLSFWLNVYNCLVIHGIIALGVEESVKEVRGFFHRIAYDIGGWRFSPDDIEHGILRGNVRHPYGLRRPFHPWDGRRAFVVEPLDPRIHFALVCGASSCPAVGAYKPSTVEDQLTLAAEAFINDPARVLIEPAAETVQLSQIFQWYARDFGAASKAVLTYLLDYLDPSPARDWLEANLDSAAIRYIPYDWSLNASAVPTDSP